MKRVLLVGAILAALSGCGGSQTAVGQNSADSITTTAVGNVVATVPSPTPTPLENAAAAAAPDNEATPVDSATTNDTATDAATSSDAHQQ